MNTARSLCTPGASSCSHPSIDSSGNDEGFIGLVCSSQTHTAFATVNSFGRELTYYNHCPSGMWAVFNFGLQTSSDFDSVTCQDDVSGRTCTSETYSLRGTTYTNPAHRCQINHCDGGFADTKQLNTLCMCLPGHYKSGSECKQCSLGKRPNAAMTGCEKCPAGYYCSSPAEGPTACGSNKYYCPTGSSSRKTASSGYYTTGGGSSTRTGQSICQVGGLVVEDLMRLIVTRGIGVS